MNKSSFKLLGLCVLLMAAEPSFSEGFGFDVNPYTLSNDWTAVTDEYLESLRGGFDAGQGLTVSFGIIRSVTINGDLVNQTSFNLPDVTRITAEQAKLASVAIAESGIVQNGLGNTVDAAVKSQLPTGALLVQNTLSNQNIQTLTVINAGVNSLGLLKTINTQTILKDALLAPLGVR